MLATLGAGHESCLRLTVVGFTIPSVAAGLVLILVIRYLFVLSLYLATGWWGWLFVVSVQSSFFGYFLVIQFVIVKHLGGTL